VKEICYLCGYIDIDLLMGASSKAVPPNVLQMRKIHPAFPSHPNHFILL
jgi:hypothetical protein